MNLGVDSWKGILRMKNAFFCTALVLLLVCGNVTQLFAQEENPASTGEKILIRLEPVARFDTGVEMADAMRQVLRRYTWKEWGGEYYRYQPAITGEEYSDMKTQFLFWQAGSGLTYFDPIWADNAFDPKIQEHMGKCKQFKNTESGKRFKESMNEPYPDLWTYPSHLGPVALYLLPPGSTKDQDYHAAILFVFKKNHTRLLAQFEGEGIEYGAHVFRDNWSAFDLDHCRMLNAHFSVNQPSLGGYDDKAMSHYTGVAKDKQNNLWVYSVSEGAGHELRANFYMYVTLDEFKNYRFMLNIMPRDREKLGK